MGTLPSELRPANSYLEVARVLAQAGLAVCGGGVRDLYLNQLPSDLDIFVPILELNSWFRVFRDSGYHQIRRRFFKSGMVLDIVSSDKSVEDIVSGFDCDVCRWYMTNQPTPLNSEVKLATDNMVAIFQLNLDLFGTSGRRADKLRSRGWTVKLISD